MSRDYIETVRDGLGVVGKMASRSVSAISKQMRGEEKEEAGMPETGLFHQRHIYRKFGGMLPQIEFYESVDKNRLTAGFVRKIGRSPAEKAFVSACYSMIYGDYPSAIDRFKDAVSSDPKYTDSYFISGAINISQGNFEGAVENFSKARLLTAGLGSAIKKFLPSFRLTINITEYISFSFYPDVIGLNILLAIAERYSGDLPGAVRTLEQIISVIPDRLEIAFFLSAFYYEAGLDEKIINLQKETASLDNLSLMCALLESTVLIEKGNPAQAEAILSKAAETGGIDPYLIADARVLLGESLIKSGQKSEGTSYIEKAKKQYPDYLSIIERLGLKRSGRSGLAAVEPEKEEITAKEPEMSEFRLVSQDGRFDIPVSCGITIGRESGDIVISEDLSASHTHARVYLEEGHIKVEDLGSTNGTWINGHKVRGNRNLNIGDLLLIGKTEFHLE